MDAIELDVTDIKVSHSGRVITLAYTRAPEPDEAMDAVRWEEIRARYTRLAREQMAAHGHSVEIFASAPECSDWQVNAFEPEARE